MVAWSIEAMRAAASVGTIVVARPPGLRLGEIGGEGAAAGTQPVVPEAPEETAAGGDPAAGPLIEVEGGATRARSVANALDGVESELVAIHDAARPLLTADLVEAVVGTLRSDPDAAGAIAAAPVTDTIKRTDAPFDMDGAKNGAPVVDSTVDRAHLWAAQTPQVFRTDALRAALDSAEDPETATDEAMLVEAAAGRVLIHPSPPENLKVTTPHDLRVAELLLAARTPGR